MIEASPRVSVVIACFNYERYVALAIRSALEQTLPPLEVVVVDDGSTDGTAAVLSAFGDRIRTITQENSGLYSRWFLRKIMPLTQEKAFDSALNTLAPLYGDVQVIDRRLGCYRLHGATRSYHATTTQQIGVRFAKQMALRTSELWLLAEHAAKVSVPLPRGNLLDHDPTFVNYRLMLKKLGEDYEAAADARPTIDHPSLQSCRGAKADPSLVGAAVRECASTPRRSTPRCGLMCFH
jgi:hypothetical protein